MSDRSVKPAWPVWYLWLTVLMVGAFTVLGYLQPGALVGSWQAFTAPGSVDLNGPLGFWMARNIAFLGIALFALLRHSREMIISALVFRFFADLFDLVHSGVFTGQVTNLALPAVPFVMTVIAAVAVSQLLKPQRVPSAAQA